jgi:hypothetical protein
MNGVGQTDQRQGRKGIGAPHRSHALGDHGGNPAIEADVLVSDESRAFGLPMRDMWVWDANVRHLGGLARVCRAAEIADHALPRLDIHS